MSSVKVVTYILFLLQHGVQLSLTYKAVDESLLFRIDWKDKSATPTYLVDVKDDWLTNQPYLHITSGNDEKYLCTLPPIPTQSEQEVQPYVGPSPAELIQSLYNNRVCSYWLDIYWTYELCHGRYVMQYHDNRETQRNARSEYYLGNYGREQSKLDDKNFDEMNPPKRKIDNKVQPYYPVTYRQGTVCDLTGKPRNTIVIYACDPDARDQIYSFAETASCTYEMVVFTKQLCSHPSFRPLSTIDHEIVCYSKDPHKEYPKPKQLLQLEKESETTLEREYKLTLELEKPSVNVGIIQEDEEENEDYGDQLDTTMIMAKQASPKSDSLQNMPSTIPVEKPVIDVDSLLQENRYLLSGKHCLYGGGMGWWKYEFCFGKSVIQFHDNPQGERTEILLGLFNLDMHKHWIDDNPQKKPLKIDGRVTQVSHLYAGGAFCEEANIHRSVEVRIRCRISKGSQTAVTLYLLEPHTCQYVLGVESSRFCDLLQTVDQYGLIQLPEA
uniref:Endoplasmic reticulum lectin 1 n=1 Tax=Elaeophora elaphi TaxID=1147741 RepID=A0A0R3RJI1_9BILA